jgi:hypothetical protein
MAFEAFATVDDLLEGWPNKTLNESETTAADALLLRASARLASLLQRRGVDIDPEDELQALNLKTVTVNMVRRALLASQGDVLGVAQTSITGGPYTKSMSFANPSGDMYLTKDDRSLLGIGGGRAGFSPLGGE